MGGFGRLFDTAAIHKADGSVIYDAIIPEMLSTLPDIFGRCCDCLSIVSFDVYIIISSVDFKFYIDIRLLKDNFIKKMSEKKQLLCMRILLVFFIVCSVVLALFPPQSIAQFIAQLMGISWGALAGAFWHHSFMAYIGKVLQGQQFGQVLSVVLALQCLTCFCRILPRLSMQERLL